MELLFNELNQMLLHEQKKELASKIKVPIDVINNLLNMQLEPLFSSNKEHVSITLNVSDTFAIKPFFGAFTEYINMHSFLSNEAALTREIIKSQIKELDEVISESEGVEMGIATKNAQSPSSVHFVFGLDKDLMLERKKILAKELHEAYPVNVITSPSKPILASAGSTKLFLIYSFVAAFFLIFIRFLVFSNKTE